jgi:phosphoglycerate dehydrogenase-like enzyme
MTFLYKSDPVRGAVWAERFDRRMPALPFRIWPDIGDPRGVRYLAAWEPPADLADDTRGILCRRLFDQLPQGAAVINVGRGGHLVQRDLLQALDTGQVGQAILDVCEPEPLPPDDPSWAHPRVALTPHIASMTQPETAANAVIENIRRHREGLPMTGLVDRGRGY